MSVDLPAPFGPAIPKISPVGISSVNSSTAVTARRRMRERYVLPVPSKTQAAPLTVTRISPHSWCKRSQATPCGGRM